MLAGVAISSMLTGATTLLQYFADEVALSSLVFWTFGDLGSTDWQSLRGMALAVLVLIGYCYLHRWDYNALLSGEETALSLGIHVRRLTLTNVVLTCFVCSVIVSHVGLINFIGLVAPHIVRMVVGNNYIYLIPGSVLAGAALLLLSDLAARVVIMPVILPIGALTAFLGGPLFLYLLLQGEGPDMICVDHLCYHYKGGRPILRDVSFELEGGRFLAVLGNNGVGKSTLLKCMNRILTADSGHCRIDGEDLLTLSHREIAKRVAFVAQHVPDTQMTVHDMVMLGRRPYMTWGVTEHDHHVVHEAMRYLNLEDMRGRFLKPALRRQSWAKVMLARALAQEPTLLLLDEPTSNLDIRNQYQVLQITRDLCREQDLTAMIVIHDLNLALRFCDRFLLLREGEVYRYGGAEIFDADALRDVYGVKGSIVQVQGQSLVLIDDEEKEKLS